MVALYIPQTVVVKEGARTAPANVPAGPYHCAVVRLKRIGHVIVPSAAGNRDEALGENRQGDAVPTAGHPTQPAINHVDPRQIGGVLNHVRGRRPVYVEAAA